ncbi:hypothetical protein ABIB45_003125 [Arthrobacter sp. UYCo732]
MITVTTIRTATILVSSGSDGFRPLDPAFVVQGPQYRLRPPEMRFLQHRVTVTDPSDDAGDHGPGNSPGPRPKTDSDQDLEKDADPFLTRKNHV